jgi:putative restriction endonuclease
LLLAVLDLFARDGISSNLIDLSPDLGELFTLYWSKVMPPDQRGTLTLPFFHLRRDGFWHLVPRPGKEAVLQASRQIRSLAQLDETILGASLDPELYELLLGERARELLRAVLVRTYFVPEIQDILVGQGDINLEAYRYSLQLLGLRREQMLKESPDEADAYRTAVRDQAFRRAVVTAYDHQCALCGFRVLTADGHTAVDAAHVIPWSISRNDMPTNGMALCRLCHWTFDEGLISVSARYLIITSGQLAAGRNAPGHLSTVAGRKILGPTEKHLWPAPAGLEWHRQKVFRTIA